MVLPTSGSISLRQVAQEFDADYAVTKSYSLTEFRAGGSYVATGTLNGAGVGIPSSGDISLTDFYGAESGMTVDPPPPVTVSLVVSQAITVTEGSTGNSIEVSLSADPDQVVNIVATSTSSAITFSGSTATLISADISAFLQFSVNEDEDTDDDTAVITITATGGLMQTVNVNVTIMDDDEVVDPPDPPDPPDMSPFGPWSEWTAWTPEPPLAGSLCWGIEQDTEQTRTRSRTRMDNSETQTETENRTLTTTGTDDCSNYPAPVFLTIEQQGGNFDEILVDWSSTTSDSVDRTTLATWRNGQSAEYVSTSFVQSGIITQPSSGTAVSMGMIFLTPNIDYNPGANISITIRNQYADDPTDNDTDLELSSSVSASFQTSTGGG